MQLAYFPLLLVVLPYGSSASSSSFNSSVLDDPMDGNCRLQKPSSVLNRWETNGSPLSVSIDMRVLSVRDVPDTGGSFGIDIQ